MAGLADAFGPIERFVRDVLPTVPGGAQHAASGSGHHDLIRRAASDRGLTVRELASGTWFHDGRLAVGGITGWVPSLVSRPALTVCQSKDLTKQLLEAAGVPIPPGIELDVHRLEDALAHLRSSARALVLKPVAGHGGAGITSGITTEQELRLAWETAREVAVRPGLVLEEHVVGVDIRAFVVGRRVVAAGTRIHPHVVGDGRNTVAELVVQKEAWRARHVLMRKRPFTVDPALLELRGLALDDVPPAGEVVVLNRLANLHLGGETADVTEVADPGLFALAVDAVRAVPGLGLAGVDLIVPDVRSADGAVILELNVGANIRVHHYPTYGRPRDVAGAIVDEMMATARHP